MDAVIRLAREAPPWLPAALAAALIAAALVALGILLSRRAFRRALAELIASGSPKLADAFRQRHRPRRLYRLSGLIERVAAREGEAAVHLLGMAEIWIGELARRGRLADFRRVLRHAPQRGLFPCFLASLDHRRLAPELIAWLRSGGEMLYVRRLALSGAGESFDGRKALEVFRDELPEIREMTGDPEWPSRYFAVKLLVHDPEARSQRAVWDCFGDAHPLVRRVAATEVLTEERSRLYEALRALYLDDTVHEVRRAAFRRIREELPDLHRLEPAALSETQALHVLELLDLDSRQDEQLAMRYLAAEDLELRHAAASFLSRCGALRRLCLEVSLGDRELLERNLGLLLKASEVNVTSFLTAVRDSQNPATLLLCARVLSRNGSRDSIHVIARRVFALFDGQSELEELYRATLQAVSLRGGEESLALLLRELARWKNDRGRLEMLLAALPERGDFLYRDWLLEFFRDPAFPARDALRETLTRMCRPEALEQVLDILRSERGKYPHPVRVEAVRLLGEMELPYCLQTVLESLPTLPPQEARDFARVLAAYPAALLRERVRALLASPDAHIRAALIAALPSIADQELSQAVPRALADADPDVRVAAVWALVERRDARALDRAVELLRDPVERVRHEVGRALGAFGSEAALDALQRVLADENELPVVKQACITGLGASALPQAVDLLVDHLDKSQGLHDSLVEALASGADRCKITRLVESLKDASSSVREGICEAFVRLREDGEQAVAELVRGDIPSLRAALHAVLEQTGYVEERIRRLAHRDPAVRQEAAEFLSLVGTQAAFRGIVLAARDPDQEVRVRVVRALERLQTPEGQAILQSLENDPDSRVRRYTHWALQRLRAKAL